jgi:glycosyltransferase involved in cell wall biosynthesis
MSLEKRNFRIVCFIPAKNCQNSLAPVIAGFTPEVLSYIEEIVVIDNGSSDQTVQTARECLARIEDKKCTILQNSRNFGLGGSHKIAFNYAFENSYDYMIVLHGDNSVSITDALPILRNHRYLESDAALGSRFILGSRRKNYPIHRNFFNRILSILASIITRRKISDFTGSAISFYRVSSFLTKFENPIKRFSNDVAFPQYLLLYAAYRRLRVSFFPIEHHERDIKQRDKLVSQFGKAALILLKFLFFPQKTIDHDVYGTFFGHTFRRIKVKEGNEVPAAVVKPQVVLSLPLNDELELPKKVQEEFSSPKVEAVEAVEEVSLIDLGKLKMKDSFIPGNPIHDVSSIESCDLKDDDYLCVRVKLDVETITSKALRSTFLKLFKTYSPEKIILDINADRVLRSTQFYQFLQFTSSHNLDTSLVTMNPGNIALWKLYSPLVNNLILNYEYGSNSREDFLKLMTEHKDSPCKLKINILSHHQHFYYCYGLYDLLRVQGTQKSLRLQPYLSGASTAKPADHIELLSNVPEEKNSGELLYREHFQLSPGSTVSDLKIFNESKEFGFSRIKASENQKYKTLFIDHRGNLFREERKVKTAIGTVYDGSGSWVQKLVQNPQEI